MLMLKELMASVLPFLPVFFRRVENMRVYKSMINHSYRLIFSNQIKITEFEIIFKNFIVIFFSLMLKYYFLKTKHNYLFAFHYSIFIIVSK